MAAESAKISLLFNERDEWYHRQLELSGLNSLIYECLKDQIISAGEETFIDFNSWDKESGEFKKTKEYFKYLKGKSRLKAATDFLFEYGVLNEEEIELIGLFINYRNTFSHELLLCLTNDLFPEGNIELLKLAIKLARKISNWRFTNFEYDLAPEDYKNVEIKSVVTADVALVEFMLDKTERKYKST